MHCARTAVRVVSRSWVVMVYVYQPHHGHAPLQRIIPHLHASPLLGAGFASRPVGILCSERWMSLLLGTDCFGLAKLVMF